VKLLSPSKLGQIKVDRDDARDRCSDWSASAFRSGLSIGLLEYDAAYRTDNGLFSGIAANCFRACGLSPPFFSLFFFFFTNAIAFADSDATRPINSHATLGKASIGSAPRFTAVLINSLKLSLSTHSVPMLLSK
jgi:hypothetical protein